MLPMMRSVLVESGAVIFAFLQQRVCFSCLAVVSVYSQQQFCRPTNRLLKQQMRYLSATTILAKGHSKWQNIKATKTKNDDERSKKINMFVKRLKKIVQKGGFDVKFNKKLVDLEKEYLKESLPLDTFNKCLQQFKDKPDVTNTYQLIGPGGSFFIVEMEGETKSKIQNALLKALKKLPDFRLTDSLLNTEFEEKGVIVVDSVTKQSKLMSLEEVEEIGIELECEEVNLAESESENEDETKKFELICDLKSLNRIEAKLEEFDFLICLAEAQKRPLNERIVTTGDNAAKIDNFYQVFGQIEQVKQIFDNLVEEESD